MFGMRSVLWSMLYLFFGFFPFTCLAVSIYGLASKKQTAKIILIGLHVLVKILVKKKRKTGTGSG